MNRLKVKRIIQTPVKKRNSATIVIITHKTSEKNARNCLSIFRNNKNILKVISSDKKYVEDILEKSGVMGIKYNDGFTRKRKGKKNKNYVIFDARIIEISKKYGIAIPAAAWR